MSGPAPWIARSKAVEVVEKAHRFVEATDWGGDYEDQRSKNQGLTETFFVFPAKRSQYVSVTRVSGVP